MKVEDRHISEALRLSNPTLPDGAWLATPDKVRDDPLFYRGLLAHALTLAKLECAVEALEPFATWAENEVDAEGWKNPPMRERIVDWFGPSDFRAAAEALTEIRSESHE